MRQWGRKSENDHDHSPGFDQQVKGPLRGLLFGCSCWLGSSFLQDVSAVRGRQVCWGFSGSESLQIIVLYLVSTKPPYTCTQTHTRMCLHTRTQPHAYTNVPTHTTHTHTRARAPTAHPLEALMEETLSAGGRGLRLLEFLMRQFCTTFYVQHKINRRDFDIPSVSLGVMSFRAAAHVHTAQENGTAFRLHTLMLSSPTQDFILRRLQHLPC